MDSNFNLQQIEYEIQIRNNKIYSKVYFSPGKLEMMNEQIKGHLKITTVNGYYIKLTSDPGCDAIAIWSGLVPGGKVTFSVVNMSKHHYNLCFEIIMIIPTDFTHSCFIFFFFTQVTMFHKEVTACAVIILFYIRLYSLIHSYL